MQIDKIKLTQIKKAEYNPRTISEENYAKLKNSVKNFGLVEPILINLKNNTIISGHQRYDVLTDLILTDGNLAEKEFHLLKYGDLGLILDTDEPTLENEDYEKALNITLNNTNLTGDYDFEKLGELLDELNLSDLDVSLTGFDDISLGAFDGFNFNDSSLFADEDNEQYDPLGTLDKRYTGENDTRDEGSLKRDFIMPPFSILKAYDSDWINIKRPLIQEINDKGQSRENLLGDMGVSIFDPVLAMIILKWFLPNQEKCKVVDCFSGDSVIGAMTSKLGHKFTGIELRQDQVDLNNSRLSNTESSYICDDGCNVLNHIEEETQDLLFSCPPYYNLEVYSDLPNDASNQGTYEDFINIIDKAFSNSVRCLRNNRFAVIVASDIRDKEGYYYPFTTDIKNIFKKNGMGLYNDIILATALNTAGLRARRTFRNRKVVKVHQNVMVFYKGDASQIKNQFQLPCEEEE